MFKIIIETAVRFRWAVVFVAALIVAFGLFQLSKLPIDAVPDITNRQVQINTIAPALAPGQIERQVTYPLETALAGIPGLNNTLCFSPALIATADDIDHITRTVDKALIKVFS